MGKFEFLIGTVPVATPAAAPNRSNTGVIALTENQISTLPPSRERKLASVAKQQGTDIAHLRMLDIEAFRPCMDAVQRFAAYGKGSSLDADPVVSKKGQRINTYVVHNKQFNAACQMDSADDPNATFAQRLARTNMLYRVAQVYQDGMENHLEREDIKRLRNTAIAEEAARFGLGNRSSQRKGRKAA